MMLKDMRAEVFRRLVEVAEAPVYFTPEEVDASINLGYAELSDESEWNEAFLELDLLEERPYYDLRTIVGESFLSIRPIFDNQTNRWLIPSSVREFDARDRRWERATGEPQRVIFQGLWWLGLFPRIQGDVGTLKVYHTALPTPLADEDDEPGFPDLFHYSCVDFAVADLFAQDGETQFCLLAWAQYIAGEQKLRAWVQDRAAAAMMRGFGGPVYSGYRA